MLLIWEHVCLQMFRCFCSLQSTYVQYVRSDQKQSGVTPLFLPHDDNNCDIYVMMMRACWPWWNGKPNKHKERGTVGECGTKTNQKSLLQEKEINLMTKNQKAIFASSKTSSHRTWMCFWLLKLSHYSTVLPALSPPPHVLLLVGLSVYGTVLLTVIL